VSTADAYKWVRRHRAEGDDEAPSRWSRALQSWGSIARMAGNDFEGAGIREAAEHPARFEKLWHPTPRLSLQERLRLFAIYAPRAIAKTRCWHWEEAWR